MAGFSKIKRFPAPKKMPEMSWDAGEGPAPPAPARPWSIVQKIPLTESGDHGMFAGTDKPSDLIPGIKQMKKGELPLREQ